MKALKTHCHLHLLLCLMLFVQTQTHTYTHTLKLPGQIYRDYTDTLKTKTCASSGVIPSQLVFFSIQSFIGRAVSCQAQFLGYSEEAV